ncbi:MAG: hypothetical protein AB1500_03250 [Bacillota bacterium]
MEMQTPNSRLEALICIAEDLKSIIEEDEEIRKDFTARANRLIPKIGALFEKEPRGVQIISIAYFINRIVNEWRERILPLKTFKDSPGGCGDRIERQGFDNNNPI